MSGWRSRLAAALVVVGLLGLPGALYAEPPLTQPLQLAFELQVDRDPPAAGQLWLLPGGATCIHTHTPVPQRLWLSAQGMTLYYPSTGDLMRSKTGKDALPSFVDAIVVSLRHPVTSLPRGAKQVSRKLAAGVVTSVWQVLDPSGKLLQVLQAKETAAGVVEMTISDSKNKLLRSYRYGPRRRWGAVSMPASIAATYYGRNKIARSERWQLEPARTKQAAPANESRCLDLGKIVREFKY